MNNVKQPLISIIVPVYNTESYVRNTIGSVLRQEYKNWELILVDDGSTDGSGRVCDEYSENDSRIRVLHKPNSGVSDTRNKGLEIAKGEWVFFLDSDDELFPNSLSKMLEWSKGVDMVVGVFLMNITDPQRQFQVKDNKPKKLIDKTVNAKQFVNTLINRDFSIAPTVSPKLYKTNIIRQNNLHYASDIYYAEDQLFLAQYVCCKETKSIHINNKIPVYQYNIWPGNATSKMEATFNNRLFTDFVGFNRIYQTYHHAFNDKYIDKWAKLCAYTSGRRIQELIKKSDSASTEQKAYLKENLTKLTGGDNDNYVVKRYEGEQNLMAMKHKVGSLSRVDRIVFVNQWLHSKDVCYEGLNDRWRKLYILSHVLGKFGVGLVIDRIGFDA